VSPGIATADVYELSNTAWRGFSDRVMGGVSRETVSHEVIDIEPCVRLTGDVRLDNNGGFIQMAMDLAPGSETFDASAFAGFSLRVRGNGETYGAHLRTRNAIRPWESYRAPFAAGPRWTDVRVPFSDFQPYRLSEPLDVTVLRRLGLVAIGRAFYADLAVAGVALYR
jgi:hypothetical protein